MTESEWLTATEPKALLGLLRDSRKDSSRKSRLFMCARCRSVWSFLIDRRSRRAVETSEQFADGLVNGQVLQLACAIAAAVTEGIPHVAMTLRCKNAAELAQQAAQSYIWAYLNETSDEIQQSTEECAFLRCIFGNPFRHVAIDQSWQSPMVTSLAIAAYEERALPSGELDNARLAILADSLEEAGCDNTDILTHLRGPGPHVRGCWPLDLCLCKG